MISYLITPQSIRPALEMLYKSAVALLAIVTFIVPISVNNPSNGISVLDLLLYFKSTLASDKRDKVYSLLGIAKPFSIPLLEIDYAVLWQEVFRRATIYIIRRSGTLNVPLCAGSLSQSLPS